LSPQGRAPLQQPVRLYQTSDRLTLILRRDLGTGDDGPDINYGCTEVREECRGGHHVSGQTLVQTVKALFEPRQARGQPARYVFREVLLAEGHVASVWRRLINLCREQDQNLYHSDAPYGSCRSCLSPCEHHGMYPIA
jgi:hypothetical protein